MNGFLTEPIQIDSYNSKFGSNQFVKTHRDGEWRISDLESLVKECELVPFDLPLHFIDLHNHYFKCEDLYEFMEQMKNCQEANLDNPIIMSCRGQILDGRHRICKAILEGRTTIKCVKFKEDISPTRRV